MAICCLRNWIVLGYMSCSYFFLKRSLNRVQFVKYNFIQKNKDFGLGKYGEIVGDMHI